MGCLYLDFARSSRNKVKTMKSGLIKTMVYIPENTKVETKIGTWSSGPLMDCDRKSTLRGLKEESCLISKSVVKRVLLENLFKGIT